MTLGAGLAGIAAALVARGMGLARVLAAQRFARTVVLASVDMEEIGFVGTRALLADLAREYRLLGALNFETMAYTVTEPGSQAIPPGMSWLYGTQVRRLRRRGRRGDFTAIIYNQLASELAAAFAEGLRLTADEHAPLLLRDPNDLQVCRTSWGARSPRWERVGSGSRGRGRRAGGPAIRDAR